MNLVNMTKEVASSGLANGFNSVKGGVEIGKNNIPLNAIDKSVSVLRNYANSASATTSAWARLGASGDEAEKRPPFEYCILLKVPSKGSALGAMLQGAAKAAESIRLQSVRVSNRVSPDSNAAAPSSASPPTTSPPPTEDPENPLPPIHAAIIDQLHRKGLQIMIVRDVFHHGTAFTMVLLNASDLVINEQLFRIKLMRWMRRGGIGDMPDRDALLFPSPSMRIMAIQHILDHLLYKDESGKMQEFTNDGGKVVASYYPLHDKAANDYLMSSVFNSDSNIIKKIEQTFLSDNTLDAIRNHFGDKIGFYYAFYTKWLYYLSPIGILTFILSSVWESTKVLVAYSAILVTWGTLMVAFWRQRSEELKTRWGLEDLDGHEKRLRSFKPEKDKDGAFVKDRDFYPMWKRYAVFPTMVPFLAVLFCLLYSVVLGVFWFEMWIVFDWGNCSNYNEKLILHGNFTAENACRTSGDFRGISGTLIEIIPGLMEGIFFEILLAAFTLVSTLMCKMQNWRTEEEKESAFAKQIFAMEFFGVFCWYFILSFFFVPILFVNMDEERDYP